MPTQITIPWKGKNLAGTVHYPPLKNKEKERFPLIIICHGFIGNRIGMDRLFVKTAQHLSEEGNIFLRFDYSGCGESEGDYGKTGLGDLIEQTIQVIEYARHLIGVDTERVTLLGHSLGGATAVLTAARDKRIRTLILWAPVGNPLKDISAIVGTKELKSLNKRGFLQYQGYHLHQSFFDSLGEYHPIGEAVKFSGDVLIIHGSGDLDIPSSYCHEYYEAFSKRKTGTCTKKIIENANHTFSHADHFDELIASTKEWMKGGSFVS